MNNGLCHYHLLHLFETAMRVNVKQRDDEDEDHDDAKIYDESCDPQFAICDIIS